MALAADNADASGQWQGTWADSGTHKNGCVYSQGGDVILWLTSNGSSIDGTGVMTGIQCHHLATCAFVDYEAGSVVASGNILGNQIQLTLTATSVGDGGCSGGTISPDFSGTLHDDSIICDTPTADGFIKLTLTRISRSNGKSNGLPPSKDPACCGAAQDGSLCCGDPIDVGSGNLYESVTDYRTARGELEFTRYYNSSQGGATSAHSLGGRGWRSTYDRYLRIVYSGNVAVLVAAERADGKEYRFGLVQGAWVCDTDVDMNLEQSGNVWALQDRDDHIELYHSQGDVGYLTRILQRNGYQQDITYDGIKPILITDSFGHKLGLGYDGDLLKAVAAQDGLVVTYNYRSSGQTLGVNDLLDVVTYSTAPATSQKYFYENPAFPFALTGVRDEKTARFTSWTYDAKGRALSSEHAGGVDKTTVAYNDSDGSRTVTTPLGNVEHYSFQGLQGVSKFSRMVRTPTAFDPGATMERRYDANGYLASILDKRGTTSSFINDTHGQPTSITEAVGTVAERKTQVTYHPSFHLPVQIIAPGKVTDLVYDSNGALLRQTETDTSDNSVPYSTRGRTRIWNFTNAVYGLRVSATGPRRDLSTTSLYGYDDNANLSAVADPLRHLTLFTNYTSRGLPQMIVDANGVTNLLAYDIRGKLTKSVLRSASGDAITSFVYDASELLISEVLPDGVSLNYTYDAAHRLRKISNSLGESISYSLDSAGNIEEETTQDASGTVVRAQKRIFDPMNRLTQVIGTSGQTNSYRYDENDNVIGVTDGLARVSSQGFDALNRVVAAADPRGGSVTMGYDALDNVTNVVDPRSLDTIYVRDGFGRVIQESSPDRGVTIYTLDEEGNRITQKDARGVVTKRSFDALNRVISETFPAFADEDIHFYYDDTTGGNKGLGRLTRFTDETGSTSLFYDEHGNVTRSTRMIGERSYTTAYSYDLADHVTSVAYPSGHIITYKRDSQGRIGSISYRPSATAAPLILATNITYLPFGPVSGLIYGNGLKRTQNYDQDYRLTALATFSSQASVQKLGTGYDALNNIVAITNLLDASHTQRFGYDENSRLISAQGIYGSLTYAYDSVGNRIRETMPGITNLYTYPVSANRLQSVTSGTSTRSFVYSDNGNIELDDRSAEGRYEYNYGGRNRLKSFILNGNLVATYHYNAFGERLIKTVGSVTTHFHYDQQHRIIAESVGASGAMIREYIWFDEMPLAQIESDGSVYFIHPDHLNTPQKLTDAAQAVVWELEQKPFGEIVSITGNESAPKLGSVGFNSQGLFQFSVTSLSTTPLIVQTSTNLTSGSWQAVTTNIVPFSFVDSNGSKTHSRFYRVIATSSLQAVPVAINLRFPGQYFDVESGLHYNLMRDYDPVEGRYIESDPIGIPVGLNVFMYADDVPVSRQDRSGRWTIAGGFTGGGGTGWGGLVASGGIILDSNGDYGTYKTAGGGWSTPGGFIGVSGQFLGSLGDDTTGIVDYGGPFISAGAGFGNRGLYGSADGFIDPKNPRHIGVGGTLGFGTPGPSGSVSITCTKVRKRGNLFNDAHVAYGELLDQILDKFEEHGIYLP